MYENKIDDIYWKKYVSINEENAILKLLSDSFRKDFENKCMVQLYKYLSLRVYVLFKMDFKIEDYLCTIADFKLRRCLSKFRLNNHGLQIEKERCTQPKTHENEFFL